MRKAIGVVLSCILVTGLPLAGCANAGQQESAEEKVEYIDDKATGIIAKGYELRAEYLDGSTYEDSADGLRTAVKIEVENDQELKSAQYEDTKLQEVCLSYLNALDGQLKVLDEYPYNSAEFYEKWQEAYDNRSKVLKTLVDDYGLTVSEKHASSLDEIVKNGGVTEKKDAAKEAINDMVAKAKWETVEEYGSYRYTAVIENTSDFDYTSVSLVVGLYDEDDVKTESYASVNSFKKGEKAKFEAYGGQNEAKRVEATVQYYDVQ